MDESFKCIIDHLELGEVYPWKEDVIGRRVEMLFQMTPKKRGKKWFPGTITKMTIELKEVEKETNIGKAEITHYIEFDDGDSMWVNLLEELDGVDPDDRRLRWVLAEKWQGK